jgi:hypothetical protein
MSEAKNRLVRIVCTDDEWKALKRIAFERELEIRQLVTAAVQTAPATRAAFTGGKS